jgi:pimeloyl-ACP methyl ester carboxylesterase
MADDALSILDGYGIARAHLVGMSLGGMIAQIIAMKYPNRVISVTAIASGIWDDLPDLPQSDQKILEYHQKASALDWNDHKAVIEYLAGGWQLLNGSAHPFDEKRALQSAEAEVKRAKNLLCMFNHALLKGGEELYGQVNQIHAPFLIIHGTEDPVLPFVHAEVMHKAIEHSDLLTLEGSGHEIHYAEWDRVISAILNHTETRSQASDHS